MQIFPNGETGLYTDMYQFMMAQGHYKLDRGETPAVYEYFFRTNPFGGGYTISAGLTDFLSMLSAFKFSGDALDYLFHYGFSSAFINYLRTFKFAGDIYAVREGEIVFPHEPVMRVEGSIIECQLIETMLLNIMNFESLIATKAARSVQAANGRPIIDMGLRRAQGLGGFNASHAMQIGGVEKTSNVLAAYRYGSKAVGTMAHAWIQSFPSELDAFRAWAEVYPDTSVFLVDTYNTLDSGIPNTIKVALELEKDNHKLVAIRLDSGDFSYLSKRARAALDDAGLFYVKIIASNQLDEYLIESLLAQDSPIDIFGEGTKLITGDGAGALDGVYKLTAVHGLPKMKHSDNAAKRTLPGSKKVYRYFADDGFYADGILLYDEERTEQIWNPRVIGQKKTVFHLPHAELLHKVIEKGHCITDRTGAEEAAQYARIRLTQLDDECKRLNNPHEYKVGASLGLMQLQERLLNDDMSKA